VRPDRRADPPAAARPRHARRGPRGGLPDRAPAALAEGGAPGADALLRGDRRRRRRDVRQTPILGLDEATSALDNISERHVQRSLGLTSADRTTILVAHRLSTLRDADRIVVFDAGRIVEVGAYGELMQQGGVFAELVMSGEQGLVAEGPQP